MKLYKLDRFDNRWWTLEHTDQPYALGGAQRQRKIESHIGAVLDEFHADVTHIMCKYWQELEAFPVTFHGPFQSRVEPASQSILHWRV